MCTAFQTLASDASRYKREVTWPDDITHPCMSRPTRLVRLDSSSVTCNELELLLRDTDRDTISYTS